MDGVGVPSEPQNRSASTQAKKKSAGEVPQEGKPGRPAPWKRGAWGKKRREAAPRLPSRRLQLHPLASLALVPPKSPPKVRRGPEWSSPAATSGRGQEAEGEPPAGPASKGCMQPGPHLQGADLLLGEVVGHGALGAQPAQAGDGDVDELLQLPALLERPGGGGGPGAPGLLLLPHRGRSIHASASGPRGGRPGRRGAGNSRPAQPSPA